MMARGHRWQQPARTAQAKR
uniref:Uncharacterized protein n=1 Tax=Arundo donax TaxID=35708 RepID=A0A0A9AJN5_ARUDO